MYFEILRSLFKVINGKKNKCIKGIFMLKGKVYKYIIKEI